MKGYRHRPEATAEAIRDGWFHTGDLARVDEDGYFFIAPGSWPTRRVKLADEAARPGSPAARLCADYAELAFTGAAAGLLVANNPVVGALIGAVVVAGLIALLGARPRERDSAIGVILAFGMGIGVLLLGFYHGFATAATNILFGNIFGVSGSQLIVLLVIGLIVVAVMGIWYRPLLFASVDPDAAEARGVPVRRLGLLFLIVLALTVTGAAQVVGTLLVLSLAITPAAAAQRLSASPLVVAGLSIVFAVVAADGGLLASFQSNVKASVFITSVSFATYVIARLTGPLLRDHRSRHQGHPPRHEATPLRPTAELPGTPLAAASSEDGDGSGNPAIRPWASGT